ncbi:MAG TPA: tRNA 2-thiouridine(34) synthase MnmA, partial [Deltaproteobacteria bacterium]|nr:tRNA 2-thiouridine(34) synthase MnmA [Deltaproteobacteria bacterium]
LRAREVNWITAPPEAPIEAKVRIRYRHNPVDATVIPQGEQAVVRFSIPQRAVTPGQAVVFYKDDEVLGGGWIERAIKEFDREHA